MLIRTWTSYTVLSTSSTLGVFTDCWCVSRLTTHLAHNAFEKILKTWSTGFAHWPSLTSQPWSWRQFSFLRHLSHLCLTDAISGTCSKPTTVNMLSWHWSQIWNMWKDESECIRAHMLLLRQTALLGKFCHLYYKDDCLIRVLLCRRSISWSRSCIVWAFWDIQAFSWGAARDRRIADNYLLWGSSKV